MTTWLRTLTIALLFFLVSPDAQAKNILIVGDSHSCGSFGQQLVKQLGNGNEVTLYCKVGSSPQNWIGKESGVHPCRSCTGASCAKGPQATSGCQIDSILKAKKYDQVIAAFGTNSVSGGTAAGAAYSELAKKIKAASNSCKWVGPPQFAPNKQVMQGNLEPFYKNLGKSVSDACKVIDSRDATPREGGPHKLLEGDGYHRTKKGGELWADGILEEVRDGGGDQNVAPRQPVPRAEPGRS